MIYYQKNTASFSLKNTKENNFEKYRSTFKLFSKRFLYP